MKCPLFRGLFFSGLLAIAFFGRGLVLGQEPQGKKVDKKGMIGGTVTDQSKAVVTGANVELSNQAGTKQESKTDEKGNFAFGGLDPGTYTLTVSAPNFAAKVMDNIGLTEGLELNLEVTLEPQSAKSEIKVEASGVAQVEVENATVAGTITQKEVVSIGLNGRNFTQLIALAPGVSNQTGQDEATVGVTGSVKYSINGGRVEYNSFEIDGSDVLNTGLNKASSTLMVYPSLDAIQEVKILTSNYGAQYGRTASGTVQVMTKSGTNALHGNVYDFVRNEVFNSRNYFDQTRHAPLYRRQDFGGTIGGPLTIPGLYNTQRDKTFFFFSEEARLEKTPTQYNQAVPSLLERGLRMTPQGLQPNFITDPVSGRVHQVFDFSDVCPVLNSPEASGFSRGQFPDCPINPIQSGSGHLVPPLNNDLGNIGVDKNALALLNSNLIPLPNSPFGCNYRIATLIPSDPNHCYVATVSPSTYWREELFRIDQQLSTKLKLSFRYIHDAWDTTVLTPQWGITRNTFPTVQNRFIGPGTDLVASLTHTISPTLINTVHISYTNSTITLGDQNGPGGARFQRDPTLNQPSVADPTAPGQCNPQLNLDPSLPPPSPGGGGGFPQCGMGYLFNNGFGGKMPGINIQGTNAAYGGRGFAADPSYMPWSHTNPSYSVRDDVGLSIGKHTLQLGGQYILAQRNQTNNAIGAASGDLQGFLTFSNLAHSTGNAFADLLATYQSLETPLNPLGEPIGFIQSFSQDSSQHRYYQHYQIAEPYIQDDWKVTRQLTLNLGLRVSLFGTYHEHNRNIWNWEASRFDPSRFAVDPFSGVLLDKKAGSTPIQFNPSTFQLDPGIISALGLVHCGTEGIPSSCMKGHLFNPAPRIGFAWDPRGNGQTAIRAGYGIFFEHGTGVEANTGSLEASAPVVLSVTQPLPLSYMCIGNVGYGAAFDPTNSGCSGPAGVAPPRGSLFPLNVTSIPTKAVWPYAQQWSFGIQQELPQSFLATFSYVGSKGTHLTIEPQLNQLRPLPVSENPFGPNEPLTFGDCTNTPTGTGFPGDGTTPFFLQNGTVVSPQNPAYVYLQAACTNPHTPNVNALPGRPYPGLGQVLALENVANSSYNALQVTLRRSHGPLTVGISYSYSHSFDNSSDRSDPVLVNSYDLRGNRASSNFDQRHLLNISYVYRVPGQSFVSHFCHWANDTDPPPASPQCPARLMKFLFDNWEISGVTLYQTGTPFTVINSSGNNGISLSDNAGVSSQWLSSGLGIAESYPDLMPGLPKPAVPAQNVHSANPLLNSAQSFGPLLGNPSTFVAPRGLTFGDAGRNFLNNPSRLNFDLTLARHIKIKERSEIEFRMEAFNIFNHTQFRIYDPDNPGTSGYNVVSCYAGPVYSAGFIAKGGADCVSGASFLHPVNAHRPRTIQFGLKLGF